MSTTFVSAAATMLLLSLPSQVADVPNRGLGAPMVCPGSAASPLRLYDRHGCWPESDAMHEIHTRSSRDMGSSRAGAGIKIADSRGRIGSLILDNDQLDN